MPDEFYIDIPPDQKEILDVAFEYYKKAGYTEMEQTPLVRYIFRKPSPKTDVVFVPPPEHGKSKFPTGKGIYIWELSRCAGGDMALMAQQARVAGLAWVSIKIAHEESPFNEDHLKAAVDTLRKQGIGVWAWHYVTGFKPALEAKVAIARMMTYNLDGYMIDAEAEYKTSGRSASAKVFMQELKSGLGDRGIGLCSYRYPTYHKELPWSTFLENGVDFHQPQVYWEQSHNPGAQLERSTRELKALKDLPIIPLGSVYGVGGWVPTIADLKQFRDAAKKEIYPGYGWYAWHSAFSRPEWWKEVSEN